MSEIWFPQSITWHDQCHGRVGILDGWYVLEDNVAYLITNLSREKKIFKLEVVWSVNEWWKKKRRGIGKESKKTKISFKFEDKI